MHHALVLDADLELGRHRRPPHLTQLETGTGLQRQPRLLARTQLGGKQAHRLAQAAVGPTCAERLPHRGPILHVQIRQPGDLAFRKRHRHREPFPAAMRRQVLDREEAFLGH